MINLNRLRALVIKEIQDLGRNRNVLLMIMMPLGFCILYKYIFMGREGTMGDRPELEVAWQVLSMCLGMSLLMICSFSSAMMIAEEKEKMTLRTLLLSGVTPLEFFLGKAFFCTVMAFVVNLFMFFYIGMPVDAGILIGYGVLTLILTLVLNLFGALIGVIAPNQMATGVIGMPLMIAFLLLPMFATLSEGFARVAKFVPVHSMNLMLEALFKGEFYNQMGNFGVDMAVIGVWLVLGFAAFHLAYRRLIRV